MDAGGLPQAAAQGVADEEDDENEEPGTRPHERAGDEDLKEGVGKHGLGWSSEQVQSFCRCFQSKAGAGAKRPATVIAIDTATLTSEAVNQPILK